MDSRDSNWDSFYIAFPNLDDGDETFYNEMKAFILANPLTVPANFETLINTYVEIDNIIDYVMIETFCTNP